MLKKGPRKHKPTVIKLSKTSAIRCTLKGSVNLFQWFFPSFRSAVVIVCFWLIELTMLSAHPNNIWLNDGLSLQIKLGFAILSLVVWMLLAWLGFWFLSLMQFVCIPIHCRGIRLTVYGIGVSSFILITNLYFVCWCFYWRLGVFPDADGIYFAGLNARMLFLYFWQAERHLLWSCFAAFLLISIVCIPVVRSSYIRCLEKRTEGLNVLIPGLLLLVTGANLLYLFIGISHASDNLGYHQDRIEAVLHPWASDQFELKYHVNPMITLVTTVCIDCENQATGQIPLEHLTPLGSLSPQLSAENLSEERLNIVLITIESLRSDTILKEHQKKKVMPYTALLCHEGRFFPNCYSNSTHSDYSDPAILSSLYPLRSKRHHFYSMSDPWPKVLIYEILKRYGYSTALISSQNESWSNMHLFYESPSLDLFFDSRSHTGQSIADGGYLSHWLSQTGQIAGKLDDSITVGRAIDWIRSVHAEQTPFFISINLQTSHFPYERPDGTQGPFQPSDIDFEVSLLEYPVDKISNLQNAYYNSLSYIDFQIQRLVTSINELGLRGRTVILITGDHGEAFQENGVSGHAGIPLETTTKVGLIINCPGIVKSAVDHYLAQSIDIVPSILGLINCPPCMAFQGTDILNTDRTPLKNRMIYIHSSNAFTSYDAVVSGVGWKYLYDNRRKQAALYYRPTDLEPHENMVFKYPKVAIILQDSLSEWRSQQLLYYNMPRYYNLFYPPCSPELQQDNLMLLESRAEEVQKQLGSTLEK